VSLKKLYEDRISKTSSLKAKATTRAVSSLLSKILPMSRLRAALIAFSIPTGIGSFHAVTSNEKRLLRTQ